MQKKHIALIVVLAVLLVGMALFAIASPVARTVLEKVGLLGKSPVASLVQPSGTSTEPVVAVPVPTVTLSAASTTILASSSVSLQWTSTDADACTASDGWSGAQATSGLVTIPSVASSTAFTLGCVNQTGSATSSVFVTVLPPPDTTAPSVSITSPADGGTALGTVPITANATDNVGVTSLQFSVDSSSLGSALTMPPYTITWDTASSSDGAHVIAAVAQDAAGNSGSAAITLTVASAVPAIVTGPITPSSGFGISFGDSLPFVSSAELTKELDDLVSLGLNWARIDMTWSDVQPSSSSSYSWANLDRVVAAASARGIKLVPMLGYTPAWARPAGCAVETCAPASPASFATFVRAAVTRYAPQGITSWEIWNEPNTTGFWKPAPSPASYEAVLKAAYAAVKAVQPSGTVISAGLAPSATAGSNLSPIDFLTQLYQAGGAPYFDAVGFHPYSYPAMPSYVASWNAWSQMSATTPTNIRSVMTANGDAGKQVWLTEYGAPTGGPGALETTATDTVFAGSPDHVTETVQALMLTNAVTLARGYSWVGPLFLYSYQDLGTSNATNENFFGVIRADGTQKPAYAALHSLLVPSSATSTATSTGTSTSTATSTATSSPVVATSTSSSTATLSVAPSLLAFAGTAGGAAPASKPLTVTNKGSGVMNWTVSHTQTWLSVTPTSGSATGTLTVSVTSTSLAAGAYSATVTVTAPGASSSPVSIPVALVLAPKIALPGVGGLGSTSTATSTGTSTSTATSTATSSVISSIVSAVTSAVAAVTGGGGGGGGGGGITAPLSALPSSIAPLVGTAIPMPSAAASALPVSSAASGGSASAAAAPMLTTTNVLATGVRGTDVRTLQTLLSSDPTLLPKRLVTGFYGVATTWAVEQFQIRYAIPLSTTTGDAPGIVGQATREKLNEIFGTATVPVTAPTSGGATQPASTLSPQMVSVITAKITALIAQVTALMAELRTLQGR